MDGKQARDVTWPFPSTPFSDAVNESVKKVDDEEVARDKEGGEEEEEVVDGEDVVEDEEEVKVAFCMFCKEPDNIRRPMTIPRLLGANSNSLMLPSIISQCKVLCSKSKSDAGAM